MLHALPSLSLLVLFAFAGPQELAHRLAKDGKSTRTVERSLDLRSTRISVGLGAVSDGGTEGPKLRFVDKDRFTVSDTHVEVSKNTSMRFTREFASITGTLLQGFEAPEGFEDQSDEETLEKRSALERRTVQFDRDGQDWKASWPKDQEGDPQLLKGLRADLDFAGLLPRKGQGHDESWTIDSDTVRSILMPGGVPLCDPKDESPNVKLRPIWLAIDRHLVGEAKAVLREPRQVGGQTYAVLGFEGKASAKGAALEDGTLTLEIEFEGEALWDLADARLHSLDVQGETKLALESKKSRKLGSKTIDVTEKAEFEGTLTASVR